MDTRQLAAFCAVVELRSFSQAAERLGVTQPAVSLQVRALEKRRGASWSIARGAGSSRPRPDAALPRCAATAPARGAAARRDRGRERGELSRRAVDRCLHGAGCDRRPLPSVRVPATPSSGSRPLEVHDTQTVVERVADRELELGIVGAARRHRSVRFEPFMRDEVILACPPGHRFAGRKSAWEELREEPLIIMQAGAGVRQVVEDALRALGLEAPQSRRPSRARSARVGTKRGPGRLRRLVHLAGGGGVRARGRIAGGSARGRSQRQSRDLARARNRPGVHEDGRGVRRLRPGAARLTAPSAPGA